MKKKESAGLLLILVAIFAGIGFGIGWLWAGLAAVAYTSIALVMDAS